MNRKYPFSVNFKFHYRIKANVKLTGAHERHQFISQKQTRIINISTEISNINDKNGLGRDVPTSI